MKASTVRKMEEAAAKVVFRAKEARARMQSRCSHPLANVILYEGAVETHHIGGNRSIEIRIVCGLCEFQQTRNVLFHND